MAVQPNRIPHAILSRVHRIERPFLAGFLAHHLDALGFDRAFLIRGDEGPTDWLEADLGAGPWAERVEILAPRSLANINDVFIEFMPMLAGRCDWVQLADIDEFLYLGGKRIAAAMAAHETRRQVHFRWLMTPSAAENPVGVAAALDRGAVFPKGITKAIFRPRDVGGVTAHAASWRRPVPASETAMLPMAAPLATRSFQIHVSSRGLYDILLKSIWQRFGEAHPKTTDTAMLLGFLERRGEVETVAEVPTRFLMLMIQMQEDRAAEPLWREARDLARRLLAPVAFDAAMLAAMLADSLARIEAPAAVTRGVLEEGLLADCLAATTRRFWHDGLREDVKRMNYLNVVRKMRGEVA